MLNNLDTAQLEEFEKLHADSQHNVGGGDGPNIVNVNIQMQGLQRDIKLSGIFYLLQILLLYSS